MDLWYNAKEYSMAVHKEDGSISAVLGLLGTPCHQMEVGLQLVIFLK